MAFSGWLASPAAAQQPTVQASAIETPVPPSLLLPNYNRVLIGEKEAIEAGAFVARAAGATAAFYNPAGLGHATSTGLTAGLSTQEWIRYSVQGEAANDARTTNDSLGGVFGIVFVPKAPRFEKWRFGFLMVRPVSIQPALELRSTVSAPSRSVAITYVTTSSLSDFAPTLAGAYNYSPTLRFGGSVRWSSVSLYQNQTMFADLVQGNTLRTVEGTLFGNGSVASLVLAGGVQWEPRPHVAVGVQVTLPSMRLFGTSSGIYRGADLSGANGILLAFADSKATFRYRQPFSVSAGLGWTSERVSIEVDVKQHAATGRYDLFASDQPIERTIVSGTGVVADAEPFPTFRYAGHAVTNIALGGKVHLSDAITAHAGVYTDRSPVGADDVATVFARMNLAGVTAGAAINIKGFVGSVGLAYISGQRQLAIDWPLGATLTPTLRIRSLQLLYAVSLTF